MPLTTRIMMADSGSTQKATSTLKEPMGIQL